MDHLKSVEERRNRWYYKDVVPRYVSRDVVEDKYGMDYSILVKKKKKKNSHCQRKEEDDDDDLCKKLAENGFVIVSNVLNCEECKHAISLAKDFIEAATFAESKLQSPQQETNNNNSHSNSQTVVVDFPCTVEGGILPFYGSGHSTFQWYLRSHPNIQNIFALLHNLPDDHDHDVQQSSSSSLSSSSSSSSSSLLCTSLDGMIVWTLSHHPSEDKGWFHIDHNPYNTNHPTPSVQALVNLLTTTPQTGGNVLIQKSHLLFPHHYTSNNNNTDTNNNNDNNNNNNDHDCFYHQRLKELNGDDWLEMDPHDPILFHQHHHYPILHCSLQPGDVLLWDSRTVHCSHPPTTPSTSTTNNESHDDDNWIRIAGLVNMIPRTYVSDTTRQQRLQAIHSFHTLTHWVHKTAALANEQPTEEKSKHSKRIQLIQQWEQQHHKSVLLTYQQLTPLQQSMI